MIRDGKRIPWTVLGQASLFDNLIFAIILARNSNNFSSIQLRRQSLFMTVVGAEEKMAG